jgi:hypothetical protein
MIEFLTLFLGLVGGPQVVEVAVDSRVAVVEMRLDGEQVGRLAEPPWRLEIDLGKGLAMRELAAIAFDDDGEEVGRVSQYLNRPRPSAEAGILLERDGAGRAVAARLTWESVVGQRPREILVTLDGEPLPVADPEKILLPAYDPKAFHFLYAELVFPGEIRAQTQIGFGGEHLDEVSSELTALPVSVLKKGRQPSREDYNSWFLRDGEALSIVAVEKGQADLVVVRGVGVERAMERLEGLSLQALGGGLAMSTPGVGGLGDVSPGVSASEQDRLRRAVELDSSLHLRIQLTQATKVDHRYLSMEQFAASPEITSARGGLYWVLTQEILLPGLTQRQRVSDAVARAGLRIAAGNRRRALVLVLSPESVDNSLYSPEEVRSLLRSLGVPLWVWCIGEEECDLAGWSDGSMVTSLQDLQREVRQIQTELDRQRIVWVDGDYLPQTVSLATDARLQWLAR